MHQKKLYHRTQCNKDDRQIQEKKAKYNTITLNFWNSPQWQWEIIININVSMLRMLRNFYSNHILDL